MKKFIFAIVLFVGTFINANAQTAIETPKILDNVYLGVQGGAMTALDFNSVLPVNAAAGLKIGKEFTPVWGLNVEGDVLFGNNHFMDGKTFVRSSYVGVNGTLNLTNLLFDYRADRVFTVSVESGLGWIHNYNSLVLVEREAAEFDDDDLGAKTGLVFALNLGSAKKWQVYANPTVMWNLSKNGSIQFNKNNAQLGVFVGVAYKFKNSNGTHNFKVWNVGEMNSEINKLRAENEVLKNQPPKIVEKIVERQTVVEKQTGMYVTFAQNSSVLTDEAKAKLDRIPRGSEVYVKGGASPEGTERRNTELIKERETAVKAYLEGRGVKVTVVSGVEATRRAVIEII